MATNKDNNWIDINGGRFPATIGEDFFNYTPGQWTVGGGVNGGDRVGDFSFGDPYYSWQNSNEYGSFRDYVGIHNKNNMAFHMERDKDGRSDQFNFDEWVNQHPQEYEEYRDENGTWYLDEYAKADLVGRAYAEWDKEHKAERNSHSPEVKIKTGKKEGTVVNYRWDDSLNAYVPAEGHVEYWDTNNGFGHALKGMIGFVGTAISTVLGGGVGGLAFGSAFNVLNGLTNGDSLFDSLKGGVPVIGSYIGGEGNTGWLGELMRTTFDAEGPEGNLKGLVNQWKSTRDLSDKEKGYVSSLTNSVKNAYKGLTPEQEKDFVTLAENLVRAGALNDKTLQQAQEELAKTQKQNEVIDKYTKAQTLLQALAIANGNLGTTGNTNLGFIGNTSLGSGVLEQVELEKVEDAATAVKDNKANQILGALGGAALLGGGLNSLLGSGGSTSTSDATESLLTGIANMADGKGINYSNLFSSLVGLGADGFGVYRNYKDQKNFGDLFNNWSGTAGSLVNKGQNLASSLQNLYDKTANGNDKLYEALKEKIKVPTRNGDEWQSTPYYQTATQGSQNVNNAFAKALNAADQISGVYNDLGKAKFYNEDDVYGTYRKFANARTQLADRAAALTDSRTYAANRANGVGTSTVQQEAQAENARKYMADLANIDSQAYTDALSYVSNLSKLQTDQRNAAIAEAVSALSPTISTSTNDATNQLRNSQNEIGALWYGDKAADLERGWLANTYGIGLQNQGNILNALVGLNSNNVNAATQLAGGFANAYGNSMNGLGQAINKTAADVAGSGNGTSGLLSALGLVGKGASSASGLFDSINFAGANAAADTWNALVERTALQNGTSVEEAAKWLMDAGGDPIQEIINASESGGFWSGLGDSLSGGWDSVTGAISSGWDSLSNWFGSLW
ncbi:hypothetical protein [Parasutterella excrementihominis]|uniref:hypothetical protein n=1 Tax=Parasutterella excrementihominis TaxID=487175 RepID=UPI003AEF29FD